jgi:hypothetical protein
MRFLLTPSIYDSLIPSIYDSPLHFRLPILSPFTLVVSVVAIAVTEVLAYTSPPPSILYPRFYTLDSIPSDLRRPRASL